MYVGLLVFEPGRFKENWNPGDFVECSIEIISLELYKESRVMLTTVCNILISISCRFKYWRIKEIQCYDYLQHACSLESYLFSKIRWNNSSKEFWPYKIFKWEFSFITPRLLTFFQVLNRNLDNIIMRHFAARSLWERFSFSKNWRTLLKNSGWVDTKRYLNIIGWIF